MTYPPLIPRVVHLQPGETVAIWCTCRSVAGGYLVDDPACAMHHGEPTLYIFGATSGSAG